MLQELYDSTIEYKDNRISLYCAQNGKCAITGKILNINDIHCHHKIPKKDGGTDEYTNLIILDKDIHILVHAKDIETIQKYISLIKNDKQLNKINNLRRLCGLTNIETI